MGDAPIPSMFREGSLTLFRVRGIPIRAHWTLLLVVPYLAFALSLELRSIAALAGVSIDHLLLPPLAWGLTLALGLFASVTLHELAHCAVALRFGGRVRAVTLMLVGGVSQLGNVPRRPGHEALMAAAGPATSLALGGALYLGYAHARALPADLQMGLFYLASMNIALGAFNLIPAFPMDGGRLLRSALAARLGAERATALAAGVGRVCAVLLGLLGIWSSNLLLILVAVFVYSGARSEQVQEQARGALAGLVIADLVPLPRRPPPTVATYAPLDEALARMRELDRLELVVLDPQGAPVAVLLAGDLRGVPAAALATRTVGALVRQLPARHIVVPWGTAANEALERAAEVGATYVIVTGVGGGRTDVPVALLSPDDVARAVELRGVDRRRAGRAGRTGSRGRPGSSGPGADATAGLAVG